jgi:hypothetical protein
MVAAGFPKDSRAWLCIADADDLKIEALVIAPVSMAATSYGKAPTRRSDATGNGPFSIYGSQTGENCFSGDICCFESLRFRAPNP